MKGWQEVPEECCGKCKYFRRHYRRSERGRYEPLWCGHCVHPRLKNRRVEECCPHFKPIQEDAEEK